MTTLTMDCAECGGDGLNMQERSCSACDGTGRAEVPADLMVRWGHVRIEAKVGERPAVEAATCGAAMPDYEDEKRDGPFLCTFPKFHLVPFTYAEGDYVDDPISTDHGNPERGGFWSLPSPTPADSKGAEDGEAVEACASCGEPSIHRINLNGQKTPVCLRHLNHWRTPDFTSTAPDGVNELAALMFDTWRLVDPASTVSTHPASFMADFADMARAVLAAGYVSPTEVASLVAAREAEVLREAAAAIAARRPNGDDLIRVTQRPIPKVGVGERTMSFIGLNTVHRLLTDRAAAIARGDRKAGE